MQEISIDIELPADQMIMNPEEASIAEAPVDGPSEGTPVKPFNDSRTSNDRKDVTISLNSEISEEIMRLESIPDNFAEAFSPENVKECNGIRINESPIGQEVFDMLNDKSRNSVDNEDVYGINNVDQATGGSQRNETSFQYVPTMANEVKHTMVNKP